MSSCSTGSAGSDLVARSIRETASSTFTGLNLSVIMAVPLPQDQYAGLLPARRAGPPVLLPPNRRCPPASTRPPGRGVDEVQSGSWLEM